jgi:hypothetical protein
MYFNKFKEIYYDFNINGNLELKVLRDITTNVRLRTRVLSDLTLYDYYDMREGETPEIVAQRFYGNSELHWLIMLVNDRYDYIEDFPMTAHQLERHIDSKYGNQRNAVHHYVKDGLIVDNTVILDAVGVSNADYEYSLNDSKRTIKIIRPQVVGTLVRDLEELLEDQI